MAFIYNCLLLAIWFNFIYHGIYFFRNLIHESFGEGTRHHFSCSHCNETYSLAGPEIKMHCWAPRKEISTPRTRKVSYKFRCPHCQQRVDQIQIFNTENLETSGPFRIPMTDNQRLHLKNFLIKGALPFLIYMMLILIVKLLME